MTTITTTEYKDSDFVYVDIPNKKIIGLVEWDKNGNAVKKEYIDERKAEEKPKFVRKTKRYYSWCSALTARRVYSVDGKFTEENNYGTFEDVFTKAVHETYWKN
jgi:hypothetical protein